MKIISDEQYKIITERIMILSITLSDFENQPHQFVGDKSILYNYIMDIIDSKDPDIRLRG